MMLHFPAVFRMTLLRNITAITQYPVGASLKAGASLLQVTI